MIVRDDFQVDCALFHLEWPVTGSHAIARAILSAIQKVPVGGLRVAQNLVRGRLVLTADKNVLKYPDATRLI